MLLGPYPYKFEHIDAMRAPFDEDDIQALTELVSCLLRLSRN